MRTTPRPGSSISPWAGRTSTPTATATTRTNGAPSSSRCGNAHRLGELRAAAQDAGRPDLGPRVGPLPPGAPGAGDRRQQAYAHRTRGEPPHAARALRGRRSRGVRQGVRCRARRAGARARRGVAPARHQGDRRLQRRQLRPPRHRAGAPRARQRRRCGGGEHRGSCGSAARADPGARERGDRSGGRHARRAARYPAQPAAAAVVRPSAQPRHAAPCAAAARRPSIDRDDRGGRRRGGPGRSLPAVVDRGAVRGACRMRRGGPAFDSRGPAQGGEESQSLHRGALGRAPGACASAARLSGARAVRLGGRGPEGRPGLARQPLRSCARAHSRRPGLDRRALLARRGRTRMARGGRGGMSTEQDAHEWNERAKAELTSGEPGHAVEYARRAHELARRNPIYLNTLGVAHAENGDMAQALVFLRRAVKLKPDFVHGIVNLAKVLEKEDDRDAAQKAYEHAYQLSPSYPTLALALARIYRERGLAGRARALLETAPDVDPQGLAIAAAACTFDLEGEDAAIAQMRAAVDAHPDWKTARTSIGHLLLATGHWRDGWRFYRDSPLRDLPPGRIALCGEQGIGDVLFFLRFVPALGR